MNPARRYDNAEEMLRAWRKVCDESEQRKITGPPAGGSRFWRTLEQADSRRRLPPGFSPPCQHCPGKGAEVLTVSPSANSPSAPPCHCGCRATRTGRKSYEHPVKLRERFPNPESDGGRNLGTPTLEAAGSDPWLRAPEGKPIGHSLCVLVWPHDKPSGQSLPSQNGDCRGFARRLPRVIRPWG